MGCGGSKSADEKTAKPTAPAKSTPAAAAKSKQPPPPPQQQPAKKSAVPADDATHLSVSDQEPAPAATAPVAAAPHKAEAEDAAAHEPIASEEKDETPAAAVPVEEAGAATAPAEETSESSEAKEEAEHVPQQTAAHTQQRRSTAAALHQENQTQRMADANSPYVGPGPTEEFPIDNIYRCFDEENGLLFRVVNNRRHMWAFYNDTTDYVMRVSVTFGPESSIKALGNTRQTVLDDETGECRLELDVAPGETQKFMRGEYNGFTTCYDACPLDEDADEDGAHEGVEETAAAAVVEEVPSHGTFLQQAAPPVDSVSEGADHTEQPADITAAAAVAAPASRPATPPPPAVEASMGHEGTNAHFVEEATVTHRKASDDLVKKVRQEA
ncbi:hypothetical protein NESM_000725100 [Novymonas esmeraldas]|uniref:DUF1935 domain-containing protein n=1 Tax=Novymonas esmeraldas TaxID=1808958 RepID=A0AAW0EXW1_9TRYP